MPRNSAWYERAKARGIPNFHIFGEVATNEMDPAHTAVNTVVDGLPSILDMAFARAVQDTVGGAKAPSEMARLFRADPVTQRSGESPVFVGGDVVTGPSTIIQAIGAGQRAARAIEPEALGELREDGRARRRGGPEPDTIGEMADECQQRHQRRQHPRFLLVK